MRSRLMARLEGLEPTTSAFAGLRSNPTELQARNAEGEI